MRSPAGTFYAVPGAMFFGTFAWSFVYVSLPFHVQAISTVDAAATLRWTGWILGISNLVTVVTAPLWGWWAERSDPRRLYLAVQVGQGLAFVGMALARTLLELFFVRLVLGLLGAASTFAFVMAGRGGDAVTVRRQVAAVQSAMTVAQVIGPLAGAIAAARLGFRPSFVLGGAILIACAALVAWAVPSMAPGPAPRDASGRARPGDIAAVACVVLAGNVQIFFLAAILPQVLPDLGVPPVRTLEVGGLLLFISGIAAALGAVAAPRLADWVAERRLIAALLVGSSLGLAALGLARSVWLYGTIRFLHVLCIAPVFPVIVAGIAHRAGGQAIGVINSARIGAAFVGPVVATTVLASAPAAALYALLAAAGLACVPLARRRPDRPGRP
ncbi:MAG TPA: MFS transporter [Calidithermus sp.]|nr:MFS transporter [Calidithermus sp.]